MSSSNLEYHGTELDDLGSPSLPIQCEGHVVTNSPSVRVDEEEVFEVQRVMMVWATFWSPKKSSMFLKPMIPRVLVQSIAFYVMSSAVGGQIKHGTCVRPRKRSRDLDIHTLQSTGDLTIEWTTDITAHLAFDGRLLVLSLY